jgi:glycosyltransferase involved in cell wall biosynthesis
VADTRILFISLNRQWGGSEVLWLKTIIELSNLNFDVSAITFYNHSKLNQLNHKNIKHFVFEKPKKSKILNYYNRLLNRKSTNVAARIRDIKPDLVVISQGGLSAYHPLFEFLQYYKIPYIVVTQLVGDIHWTTVNEGNLKKLRQVHEKSKSTYFVSQHNLKLHEEILAYHSLNSFVIGNPTGDDLDPLVYPVGSKLSIAFVGRFDVYHKGLDILAKVFSSEKWQSRSVELHLYGDGVNKEQLIFMLNNLKVSNCHVHTHQHSIKNIWEKHHLGIFPSRMEGQSLALLECMKCGRPAIVTNVGGASEIITDGNNGFIAQFPNEVELDHAMERAWEARTNLEQIGNQANLSYQHYQGDAVVSTFIKAIQHDLQKR